ncbi:MAG: MFS transporter [Pseudonocardiaceae bacterium]|nr:MFS transporter [Pseudonocardiaceae bacterium]
MSDIGELAPEPAASGSGGHDDVVQPSKPVGPGWTVALSASALAIALVTLTPLQVLLPLQVEEIDPAGKVTSLSTITATGALVAIVAAPLAGMLSDRTRSRFGRRRPWVLGGALLAGSGLLLLTMQRSVLGVLLAWTLVQLGANTMYAAVNAAVPDRVPIRQRGTVSAFVALQAPVALVAGTFLVTVLITGVPPGYLALAVLLLACVAPYVLVRSDPPVTAPRPALTGARIPALLLAPWRHADFRWAFAGRFAIQLGNAIGTLYILYFLRDEVGYHDPAAGVFVLILLYTVMLVLTSIVGGWLSDRAGRRKIFVIAAAVIAAGGLAILALAPTWTGALVAAPSIGCGIGIFLAVDNALITHVLPSAEERAKDLGVINLANTAPHALGPVVAGTIISMSGSYTWLYLVAAATVLGGSGLIQPIRSVR